MGSSSETSVGDHSSPVEHLDTGSIHREPVDGVALCLSGGGYRAMIFHVGALLRLYELGILTTVKRISSVSGGSITAGLLALNWSKISGSTDPGRFHEHVVRPLRRMAGQTIDRGAVIGGILLPGTINDRVARAYREYLFQDATLQDLPDEPRFVINATNVQSGALWRFMKPYMRDYRVGEVRSPKIDLATAVAASSAFPPVLSPARLELDESDFTPGTGKDLQYGPYTSDVILSDGGVYDNLGLETAWKRYRTILVSDAGGKMRPEPAPKEDWAQHAIRVLDLVDNQVRSLRKRMLLAAYRKGTRSGAYWGIRSDIAKFGLGDALPFPHGDSLVLASTPTRLRKMECSVQERLINWGYAISDAAIRKHLDPSLPQPADFPYPHAHA